MRKLKLIEKNLIAVAISAVAHGAFAVDQKNDTEELVILGTKLNKNSNNLTQSATVIDDAFIEERGITDLTEALRLQTGIEFKQAGGPGQFNYFKLRGFGGGNTLVVIDGVRINSASDGGIGHILGQIDPNSIERIEILRGPQAVLYGAASTAGVIVITTNSGDKDEVSLSARAGSLKTKKLSGVARGTANVNDGSLSYAFSASKYDSDGVHKYEFYEDVTTQAKLSYTQGDVTVGASFWQTDNKFGYAELKENYFSLTSRDQHWAFQVPDPNSSSATKQTVMSLFVEQQLSDAFKQKIQYGRTRKDYDTRDPNDGVLGTVIAPFDGIEYPSYSGNTFQKGDVLTVKDGFYISDSTGRNQQLDYNLIFESDSFTGLIGAEYLKQSYVAESNYGPTPLRSERTKSVYLNQETQFADGQFIFNAGIRYDNNENFKDATTYNLGAAAHINDLTIFSNYGTSFTAPAMRYRFNPTYGTTNLKPEFSDSIELGFKLGINELLRFQLTGWYTEVEDLVGFDRTIPNPRDTRNGGFGLYANLDDGRTHGAELDVNFQLSNYLALYANYTYTESEGKKAGGKWIRTAQIARNKGNVGIDFNVSALKLNTNIYYSGPRLRWAKDIEMNEYVRVDLSLNYDITDNLSVNGRIENLFDEDIEEGLGYEQPGRFGLVGLDYSF